ncbi:xanthine dehydrogenase isoform X2 [Histomonas meleagridis]|uniref:xanthine dehydrogenase isoform X2 n=1 Tax=Histomonas meleagridis TaxID=135588 RepID=UPI00355A55F4|nr:xanthine dehydrogenase isoform X2 [Histomonas meleagridis]KAH0803359.1 xanthine dehydrogenase isoform X2 [Histomonas meleagridis]
MLSSLSSGAFTRASSQKTLEFVLNGKKVKLEEGKFNPLMSLTSYLRSDKVNLKGTKYVCGEGGCGACTVVVSKYDPITKKIKHRPVNSCLMPLGQAHGTSITTVEALGSVKKGLHPIQKQFVDHHATQCGYCTPGFVMNTYSLLLNNPNPTEKQIEEQFDGNLCRCTGYRSISDAIREFSSHTQISDAEIKDDTKAKICKHQDPADPPEHVESLVSEYNGVKFFVPTTLEELISLKKQYPKSEIVVGSSEVGMDLKSQGPTFPAYISAHQVKELYFVDIVDGDKLKFGASTPLQDLIDFSDRVMPSLPPHKQRLLRELRQRLSVFSSTQIRNTACVVGNIAYAGAVTDMSNFLLATDAILTVVDAATGEKRLMDMDNFFTKYRTTKLGKTDVILDVTVPLCAKDEHVFVYKQAHRREDDICIVSACIKAKINEETNIVEDIKIAYSGMAAWPQRAKQTEEAIKGKPFELSTITNAYKYIEKDLPLDDNAPGGHVPFRRELSRSFLFRFYHQVEKERGRPYDPSASDIIERPQAKFAPRTHIEHNGKQYDHTSVVNAPIHHRAAQQQTTGEAMFTNDQLMPPNGLHGGLVMSTEPHARIKSIDWTEVRNYPGVVDIVTAEDVPGQNSVGDYVPDEEVFASKEVHFVGQPIAMVLAEDRETAWKAAKLAKIEYEPLPAILNVEQAIKAKSYFDIHHQIKKGDPEEAFKHLPHVLEGVVEMGGQEQFYLETHNCIVEPKENNKLEVTSSTQNCTFTQASIARCCNLPWHNIDVHVQRIGGGFGGKETRSTVYPNMCAVAALKTNRPIRIQLDRDVDMQTSGGRHPALTKYKVGFTDEGYIKSLYTEIYADCGWSVDISVAVTDRALFHIDGCYAIDNFYTTCYLCNTNKASNTAFRGFGAPQGIMAMEAIIQHVANELGKPAEEIRQLNLYQEGKLTHYNNALLDCKAPYAWNFIKDSFNFDKMRKEVDEFNRTHKYKKRGIAQTPLKFGISFTFGALNQGGALVHVYKDGTVLVTHGGVEMGQGLHTKMAQVAAETLRVPIENVRIDETNTSKVANTSPTAASSGADLNGWAVYNACVQINERLNKYRTPNKTFQEAVMDAWRDRVDLSAHGYYSTPGVYYDWDKGVGHPFAYYVYGSAASLVEIDCLTGDHVLLRSDIIYDTGKTINPAIDIGQLEGGFIQGYGLLTMEELIHGDNDKNKWVKPGVLKTNGPGYYKIPGFNDIPVEFNAHLMPGSGNPIGIYSSKAIGEPPLLLAGSCAFAIIDAIRAARKEFGRDQWFPVSFPLTADKIRMLSESDIGYNK